MSNSDNYDDYVRNHMPAEDYFGEDPQADYDYWAKLAYWTIEEATALSFGFEPRIVSGFSLDPGHPYEIEYKKRLEQTRRAVIAKELPQRIPPAQYVAWAERVGIPFSPELAQIVQIAQAPKRSQPSEKSLYPKERQSWQKLCLGLAVIGYKYEPSEKRHTVYGEIARDLANAGIKLDQDTVRKHLQSASVEFGDLVKKD